MKTTTTITRTFEVGDMFIFVEPPKVRGVLIKGDFLLITHKTHAGFRFTTGKTVTGQCGRCSGSHSWLSSELDAGALEYQGNVKVGV